MNPFLLVAALLIVGGAVMIFVALNNDRDSLTRVFFRLWTIMPRVGSMTDSTWVLLNGLGLLLVGILLVVLFFLGLAP